MASVPAGGQRGNCALPPGWASAVDPSTSRTYYYDNTGKTQWDPPATLASVTPAPIAKSAASAATNATKGGEKRKRKRRQKTTWVYVTGLPPDATVDEVSAFFAKCGILQQEAATSKPRIKLYADEGGRLKGDGSVCYLKRPSVELALQMLDGTELRDGFKLSVTEAKFRLKEGGGGMASSTSAAEKQAKIRKLTARQALSWNEEGVEDKVGPKVVVIKHVFRLEDAGAPGFYAELEEDLRSECAKLGDLKKVTVMNGNPEGVVVVNYRSSYSAERCVDTMNNRWFDGRKLDASYWDGTTDYRVKVSQEEEKQRLESFGDWLESGGGDDGINDDGGATVDP